MEHLTFSTLDPAFNLALEEVLLQTLPVGHPGYFLLWQNGPSVIVGRHQCTADEVNADFIRRENLPVVRRITGGGAVYHDTGNLNFSFIEHANGREKVDFRRYLEPVCAALADLGVQAEISGRNDVEVGGRKISGSGQMLRRGKVLHHGTLLIDVNFERLVEALNVDPEKMRSKGVASVRSRVGNISEFWRPGSDIAALTEALLHHCAHQPGTATETVMAEAEKLADEKYRQWNWNYGAMPNFTERKRQRFDWGTVELRLDVKDGHIAACKILGDFFCNAGEGIQDLEQSLVGIAREPAQLEQALEQAHMARYFSGCDPVVMTRFFAQP
ncbi:lipoate--protein ligase [Desulfovibrio intestinalis]|uniref:lipoate--protein ligase n=1 Tax=Desulfovibrio intestinalis TaxID=58621 RepID=A0A7W8FE32_9BACT|nr:lipoate--protein ligase [Desulfovibrio intestinalis]MBB5143314.1 lipoate-protein ligase A [Desulfovibrio intestinalis]